MSDQVNCNKYAMPCPKIQNTQSVNGWTMCEGNIHESVIYVYYSLHNIDLVCASCVITQFSQLLPQTYVSLRNFQEKSICLSKCPGLLPYTNQQYLHVHPIT